jgi:hypothetical protein
MEQGRAAKREQMARKMAKRAAVEMGGGVSQLSQLNSIELAASSYARTLAESKGVVGGGSTRSAHTAHTPHDDISLVLSPGGSYNSNVDADNGDGDTNLCDLEDSSSPRGAAQLSVVDAAEMTTL